MKLGNNTEKTRMANHPGQNSLFQLRAGIEENAGPEEDGQRPAVAADQGAGKNGQQAVEEIAQGFGSQHTEDVARQQNGRGHQSGS